MIAQTVAEEILQLCTNKDIWYEDRILWKAQRHKLFATNDYIFDEISDELKQKVLNTVKIDGKPILFFWKNKHCWSLLTNRKIFSQTEIDMIVEINLDDINKIIEFQSADVTNVNKQEIEYLLLGKNKNKIWAPKGGPIFALAGILKMFPFA